MMLMIISTRKLMNHADHEGLQRVFIMKGIEALWHENLSLYDVMCEPGTACKAGSVCAHLATNVACLPVCFLASITQTRHHIQ
eukprot:scaffold90836_cov19-Tisochrysis_lutea.AAC.1